MATSITTGTMAQTTDAEFRAWITGFDALMTGPMGLVNTSDTGQISMATVAKPATANTMQGYRVYKTNDGLVDLFIKIEFGCAASITAPAIYVTVATGTDGAGGMTGVVGTRLQATSAGAPAAGPRSRFANGKAGLWWTMFHGTNSSICVLGFFLARTPSATGVPTSEGWVIYTASAGVQTAQSVRISPTPNILTNTTNMYALLPYATTDGMDGDRPMVFGHQVVVTGVRTMPNAVSYFPTTISEGVPFTIPVNGVARTFMPLGNYSPSRSAASGASSNVVMALEW